MVQTYILRHWREQLWPWRCRWGKPYPWIKRANEKVQVISRTRHCDRKA